MGSFVVDAPRSEDERGAYARLFMHSLLGNVPGTADWMDEVRNRVFAQGETRVVREGDELAGGLVVFEFGQYWGGRSVPCAGVSAVAVAPEYRGRGAARALLERSLRETREQGRALSALYPATQNLYRKLGFELAGTSFVLRVPVRLFDTPSPGLTVRAFRPEDLDAVRAVYTERAISHEGWLDRSDRFWRHRVLQSYRGPCSGYVIEEDGRIDGYVFFRQRENPGHHYDLGITDLCARTPRAWLQLRAFLGGHRSMADGVIYRSGAQQLPFGLLDEVREVAIESRLDWMLRVLDVPNALTARGYLPGLSGEARFTVHDPLIPENAGPWSLHVRGGRAVVEHTSSADLSIDTRALASLYAGYHSAHDVAMMGLARGDMSTLNGLARLFAGRPAGLPDMF